MMTDKKVFIYTLLNNEKIGKQTYWGNFKTDSFTPDTIEQNVINRNNFYNEFKISSHSSPSKFTQKKLKLFHIDKLIEIEGYNISSSFIDHREYYKTKDKKCILLFSNSYYKDGEIVILLNNGYKEYPSLYGNCRTFYKIV